MLSWIIGKKECELGNLEQLI